MIMSRQFGGRAIAPPGSGGVAAPVKKKVRQHSEAAQTGISSRGGGRGSKTFPFDSSRPTTPPPLHHQCLSLIMPIMLALNAMQVRGYTENHGRICEPHHLDAWLLSTVVHPAEREIHQDVLSATERQVAARFHFDADRERSIVARGGLRWILSAHRGVSPQALTFRTDTYGKPSMSGISLGATVQCIAFWRSRSDRCEPGSLRRSTLQRSHTRLSESVPSLNDSSALGK